ncbi:hypothetical protein GCM10020331_040730 [Ectobacillus funiculus]
MMLQKNKCQTAIFLFFSCFFSLPNVVQASPNTQQPIDEKIVNDQLNKLGIEDIQTYWEDLVTNYGGYLPESQKKGVFWSL